MIIEETKHLCPDCGSDQLKRNGFTTGGKSARSGFERLPGATQHPWPGTHLRHQPPDHHQLDKKKAKSLPSLSEKLLPAQSGDVLELDELWSFVQKKANKSWIWIGLCRRTRQVVAYAVGGRGADTCQKLKQNIPPAYSHAQTVSDLWETYKPVFGEDHRCVGKKSGETAHVERWNNTLRQRLGRFVRKMLSFSKTEENHEASLKLFIYEYNIAARHEYLSG